MMGRKMMMVYDRERKQWMAEGTDKWYSLHCGETLRLHIGSQQLDGRLELGKDWYVIVNYVPMGLIEKHRYMISIES